MAGLSDVIANTAVQTTSMPSWYDTAQQNIASQAGQIAGAAPTPQQTVGQGAVNMLSGSTNPFMTATNTAQQIASGAASPWMVNSATGQVTPDTSTALGGLFQAQNQQLRQMMPNITATPTAAGIGAGQFGSLRGQTAANKAIGDAQAQLFTQQMQAALQNQQTGVQAANTAGGLTKDQLNALLTTGQYQQAAPFTNVSNYQKILGGLQAPTTVSNTTQLSPLNQIAGLIGALGGQTGTGGILGSLGVNNGLKGLIGEVGKLFKTDPTSGSTGSSGTGFGDDGFDLGGIGIGDANTGGGGSGTGFGDDGFDLGGIGIGDYGTGSDSWATDPSGAGLF
jgi:hypothetical protein